MISTAFLAIVGAYAPTGPSRLPGTHALSTPPPQIAVHWPPGATALVALPIMAAARTPLAAQPAAPLTVLFNVFRFVQNMIVRAAARACLTAALLGLPLGLMGNMIGPPTAAYDMPSAVAISSQRTPAAPGASHVAEEVHNARRLMRGMAPTTIFRRRAEAVAADQLGLCQLLACRLLGGLRRRDLAGDQNRYQWCYYGECPDGVIASAIENHRAEHSADCDSSPD